MAEVNANSLPAKTDLGANDSAIVVDQTTNAGALVDLDVLADKVLDRISSKNFANQVGGSSNATLLAQLSTLNSNTPQEVTRQDFAVDWVVNVISVLKYGKLRIAYFGNLKNLAAGTNNLAIDGWEKPIRSVMADVRATNNQIIRINMKQSGGFDIYNYGAAVGDAALNTNFYLVYLVN